MTGSNDLQAWMDAETTGLGYETFPPYADRPDQILELAAIITDGDLNEIASFGPVVVHATEDTLALMNDYVREMHTRTGLIDKVRASTTTLADLDAALGAWLDEHGLSSRAVLSGNSVKLDFDFVRRNLPGVFGRLNYRVIDVSSFKEALRRKRPDVVAELEAAKVPSHEAMDDIRWSVRELGFYYGRLGLGPEVELPTGPAAG